MGILSRIFGSDKVLESGINAIDAMVYTDEEQTKDKKEFLKLYEPYKLAQRYLMMVCCPSYVLVWILVAFIEVINVFMVRELDTGELVTLLQGDMGIITAIIISFYFGGGAAEGIINKLKKN